MEILMLAILIGLIPAVIAQNKGRGFVGWWLFGALLFIVALPASLIVKPIPEVIEERKLSDGTMKKCPYCAELIKTEAIVCRYCNKKQT